MMLLPNVSQANVGVASYHRSPLSSSVSSVSAMKASVSNSCPKRLSPRGARCQRCRCIRSTCAAGTVPSRHNDMIRQFHNPRIAHVTPLTPAACVCRVNLNPVLTVRPPGLQFSAGCVAHPGCQFVVRCARRQDDLGGCGNTCETADAPTHRHNAACPSGETDYQAAESAR